MRERVEGWFRRRGLVGACPRSGKLSWRSSSRSGVAMSIALGVLALSWFLLRVVPKPSRAAYPCQRVALGVSGGLASYLLALAGGGGLFRWLRRHRACGLGLLPLLALTVAFAGSLFVAASLAGLNDRLFAAPPYVSPAGVAQPEGRGVGYRPGRVVWQRDPLASRWNGNEAGGNYWWRDANIDQERVEALLDHGLRVYADEATIERAWDRLFRALNKRRYAVDQGYQSGEAIAIKLNLNNSLTYAEEDGNLDASPQLTLALLRQLILRAGVRQQDITVYDATYKTSDPLRGHIPRKILVKCKDAFPQVRFEDHYGGDHGGRYQIEKAARTGDVIDYGTPAGVTLRLSKDIPRTVQEARYLINVALLKGHGTAGVTLTAKNHYGTIGNLKDHDKIVGANGTWGGFAPLKTFIEHPHLGGKTVLFLIDALYGTSSPGGQPLKFVGPPFNGSWTSSLLLSQDPVAIDSVAWDILFWEVRHASAGWSTQVKDAFLRSDNYLHVAARENLGLFEHRSWSDPGQWDGPEAAARHYKGIDLKYNARAPEPVTAPEPEPGPEQPQTPGTGSEPEGPGAPEPGPGQVPVPEPEPGPESPDEPNQTPESPPLGGGDPDTPESPVSPGEDDGQAQDASADPRPGPAEQRPDGGQTAGAAPEGQPAPATKQMVGGCTFATSGSNGARTPLIVLFLGWLIGSYVRVICRSTTHRGKR